MQLKGGTFSPPPSHKYRHALALRAFVARRPLDPCGQQLFLYYSIPRSPPPHAKSVSHTPGRFKSDFVERGWLGWDSTQVSCNAGVQA